MVKIYTCTMNLAIDLFMETQTLQPKIVNRTIDDEIQANGKGVNVSLILKKLGIESTAIGFSGGFTGKYIQEFLFEKKIHVEFIEVPGVTRINVFTQVNDQQTEYKLVNKGPVIPEKKVMELLARIENIEKGDFLCVSGSMPQGVSPSILIKISKIAKEKEFHLIIDTSYESVLECLVNKPYLLKPNEEELAAWFGQRRITLEESPMYVKELLARGAQRVLLSLGSKGCLYADSERMVYGNAPTGKVINTACAGDTLLGTFVKGLVRQEKIEEILRRSIAAGSSTAFCKGLTDFDDVQVLEKQIIIKELKE